MNLTKALREWLVGTCGIKADATDEEFKAAAGKAFADGVLTTEKYVELTKDQKSDEANQFATKLDRIADGLGKLTELLKPEQWEPETKDESKVETKEAKTETKVMPTRLAKMVASMGGMSAETDGKGIDVRVKEAAESYSTTKTAMTYPQRTKTGHGHTLAGKRVDVFGRGLDTPSELDKALAGVWAKFQIMAVTPRIAGTPRRAWELMTEHEKSLLCHLTEHCDWDASQDGKDRTVKGYEGGIKALIDDGGASGAMEAAPIVFDDQVIQAPLLNGELFPLVTQVPLDRGRRVEGVKTGTVTGGWGGVDDTAVTLFTTTSYVTAFDTTIFRWEGAIRIGLDFLSDTPIDFGAHITAQYGERLLEDLDDVIATGDGTTQPQGIMNSGAAAVSFGSAAATLSAYESLRFGVTKQEHKGTAGGSAVFCGNETVYQRAMAIAVSSTDARRLSYTQTTPNYDGYQWMNRPFKVNGSMANTQIFYAVMNRYRMYRRKGLTVRTSTEGDTLIRNGEMLIVVMARYGGKLERTACASLTTTAQA